MPKDYISQEKRYCEVCGIYIEKKKATSWRRYNERKYCGNKCVGDAKNGKVRLDPNSRDKSDVSDYIELKSKNGRLMADFNLGVLQAVEKIDDGKKLDVEGGKVNVVICRYKGVPVTGEVVKTANQWLMDNWKGKPGQRSDTVKEPEMSRDELVLALDALFEEEGGELVKTTKAEG